MYLKVGAQAGANPERLAMAKNVFEHVYVDMEPGDALFFHCNLLHNRYGLNLGRDVLMKGKV